MKRISSIVIAVCLLAACFLPAFATETVTLQTSDVSCSYDSASGKHHVTLEVQAFNGTEPLANKDVTLVMMGSQPGKISGKTSFTYNGAVKEGYVYYLNQANTGAEKKASFDFYVTLPDTMTNATDFLYVMTGENASVKAENSIPVPTYQIAVTADANGTVKANGAVVNSGASVTVVEGKTVVFEATANDGYVVDKVTYGGVEMVANSEGKYETPAVTANSALAVSFKQDTSKPGNPQTYENIFQSTGAQTVNGKLINDPMSIVFAKVVDVNGYALIDYGMEFAASSEDLTAGNGTKLSAKARSAAGNYGICIFGDFEKGKTYYTRSYAIYGKDGVQTVVYGDRVLSATPNP